MARIKKFASEQKLSSFQTFLVDDNPNSDYFRITEFKDTFTGGKNGFLIEGSEYLKESTEIKIEILDVAGNPVYFEPGNGIPEYYEGISKLIAVYIYNDTPIGLGKITILGELKEYDDNGVKRQVPSEWKGAYNVKWEKTFQINKNLANEDKVRFYRRPQVNIDEVVKPIFSGNPPTITQTGSVDGIPLVPTQNTNLSNFTLPTSYRLRVNSGNNWTGSVAGQTITFDNISYSPTIDDVVNETELIVSPPYTENNLVKSFTNEDYSITFPYIEGVGDLATALTGSFAKINITDMKTFVGDSARVKVFRRSQSNLTDYEFVQEIQLESNELLRDITTFDKKEENYGIFTEDVLSNYWATSSNDFNIQLNQNFLYNSANLDSSPNNYFYTSQSFSIQNGVEYTLDLNVRKSTNTIGDYLKIFLSGSNNSTSVLTPITTINSSNTLLQKTNFTENIIASSIETASLYFEVSGSDWYINNVSLKASQETSFSPDEITFIQQVPKTLVTETFDYRFEFYDINNNFIPVRVETTKTFVGGNTNLFNKSIEITPDNLYFSFDSASNPANAIPPFVINFDVETTLVTGSITYTSGAYDFFGNLIPEVSYSAGQYPGYLTDWDVDSGRQPFLRVQDFTGSREDITVQFIRYTGEVEGVSDTFVITRVEDGKGGVSFEIVPYRGLQIKNKESKTLEVQAIRVDGINRIDLQSGLTRGFSDAKLHLLSSSIDGIDIVNTYVSLSQAITNPNFIEGVSAGLTGSGEIDYNAIFTRDSIDNELTLYLMDGPTSESILTSIILTDLKDGLNNGVVTSTTDQFNIKYEPRKLSPFAPQQSIVTASFQRRGTTLNPLSASLVIYPSASIESKTELPHFYMFYETGAFDSTITLNVTDGLGNSINGGIPGGSVAYYEAVETKQLNLEFTYTEPITSASVTANKSFFITPDGLPGQNAIIIDIEPQPVALGSNHKGDVYNYELANTNINITQGDLFLINTSSGDPGTFTTRSVTPTNIQFTTLEGNSSTTMSLSGFVSMSALSASIRYDFDIYPYFTASLITASRTQTFTKVVEGGGAIEVTLDPIAIAFNADESGFISNYSAASTEVFIKQNDEFLLYDPTDSGTPGTFVTASISASGITFSEVSSSNRDLEVSGSGDEILHFKGFGGIERNQPSASITYNFKVYPYSLDGGTAGVQRIVSKTQTFSKVNDGSKARKVSLTTNSDTIVYDGDSVKVAPVGSVVLTATAFNATGSAYFEFLDSEGSVIGGGSSTSTTVNVDNYLPGPGSSSFFTVNLRDGNPTGIITDVDSVTVSGVQGGSTAYSVALTNGASSVTVERDGTIYFSNSGTLIRGYKGGTELQYVELYDEEAVDPVTFLPIGTFGQFSASVFAISSFLTQGTLRDGKEIVSSSGELYGSASGISNWNLPQDNTQGFITYKVDFENGRATQFIDQTFSTVFEGATGPGIVVRGEWTGSIEYIYTPERRDVVVVRSGSNADTHYFATTDTLVRSGSQPFTTPPSYSFDPATEQGDYVEGNWEYLGQQEMFVAAKIAIFEESFVENTINVGQPPSNDPNANIVIAGSGSQPFIAVGQSGIQGFRQEGIFMGIDNNGGEDGNTKQPVLSLKSETDSGQYKSLEWDGETLTIRGAIRQTAAGVVEPSLRGTWASGTTYYPQDLVQYLGETWSSNTQHTSTDDTDASTGVPGSGPWTIAAGAGKGVTLLADSYVIAYDAAGANPTPSGTMTLIASSSNFVNGFYKFTGGGAVFTDETSFTDGLTANTNTATFTIPTSYFSTPLTFRVAVAEGDQVEKISDTITITAVQPGADASPQYMITPIAGGTQLKNSSGTIELQVQKSATSGLTDVTSGTDARIYDGATLLAAQTGVTDGGNGVAYNPVITSAFITGTKTLLLKDNGGNVLDSITLLDVTDGLGGGSFISPNLKSTRNPADNSFTPTLLKATASFYDTSGTEYQGRVTITPSFSGGVDRMAVSSKVGDTEVVITASDGDGGSVTLGGSSVATKDIVLTAVFTDPATNQQSTINETFYIISDGADGLDAITVISTNQAHTLPADSAGTVTSYVGSGTRIEVYEGTTKLEYDGGYPPSDGAFSIGNIVETNIDVDGSPTAGADYIEYDTHTNMTANQASIRYGITGSRSNGEEFRADTIQTLTKAVAGASGTSGTAGQAAGIVYAGEWKLTLPDGSTPNITNKLPYLSEADLVYVVKEGSNYYTCETTHRYVGTTTGGNVVGDVILYTVDSNYYIANQSTADDPQGEPSSWDGLGNDISPGASLSNGYVFWASFGAEFTSVATDILFAEDVYANRTINIGTSGSNPVIALNADYPTSENPRIQIGQDIGGGAGFGDDGIYFGYSGGNPVLSIVTGSTFFFYQSGSIELSDASFVGSGSIIEGSSIRVGRNLAVNPTASNAYNFTVSTEGVVSASQAFIQGTIAASAGNIGNWVIDPIVNGEGGVLRDTDSELVFDPNIPEIQIYSGSVQRVFIGSSALTSTAAVSSSFDWTTPEPAITSATITSNAGNSSTVYGNVYTGISDAPGVELTPGVYSFKGIDWPTGTIAEPTAITTAGASTYPNYSPSFDGQVHGGFSLYFQRPRSITAALYLEVVDANNGNAVIGTSGLVSNIADGDFPYTSTYIAEAGGGGLQSVIGNTQITLWDGTIKLAKDCKTEDIILAWSHIDNKWVSANISKIYKKNVTEIYKVTAGGYEVEVSDNHGFWLFGNEGNSGKVKVTNIQEGITKIWIKDGDTKKEVIVDKVEKIEKEEEVITFTIPNYVNYISNNIISHNLVGSVYWNQVPLDLDYPAGSSETLTAGSNVTRNITISTATANAKLRYRLNYSVLSGNTINVAANGSLTYNYFQQTADIAQTNTGGKEVYFASSRMSTDGIEIEKSNNFVELKPAGFQLVSSENIFVRARRKDSILNTTVEDSELFRVEGGTSYFKAPQFPGQYDSAIFVEGHIRPNGITGMDLGGSTTGLRWENVWANKLNGVDISGIGVSPTLPAGPATTTTNTNNVNTTYQGYVKLTGGIIMQWGHVYNTSVITFPTTFPNAVNSVVCSTQRSTDGSRGFNYVYNYDRAGCQLVLDASYGFWIAIGW